MCSSLAENKEQNVYLIVADGNGAEVKSGVNIIDVGPKTGGRLSRMTETVYKIYSKARELDADIYHLHDPELMPIGIKLKKLGKKVIFDAHEDLPKQLLGKPYLNKYNKIFLSKMVALYERYACSKFDAIITATPFIRGRFSEINTSAVDINNFPILNELFSDVDWSLKKNEIAYIGGISKIRGVHEIVKAMKYTHGVKLNLAGSFSEPEVETVVKKYEGWLSVNELGFLSRSEVAQVLGYSKIGLVTFLPSPNHIDAQPNKMFEYMSAGIPVIASNFPLWQEIVLGNKCGLCVDPMDPKAIGEAIQYLIDHPEEAEQMGKNGQIAVEVKYNWGIEQSKLKEVYSNLSKNCFV
jgi:glycosyltransferase involved in cell wall biosynthesis